MKYLPIKNIVYRTRLKEDEIIKRLSDNVEPGFNLFSYRVFSSSSTKFYEGEIIGRHFKIRRIISHRNDFLPRISGVIYNGIVKVKMRLSVFATVFLCIWFGGVIGIACILFWTRLKNSEFHPAISIGIPTMLLFGYVLLMRRFRPEVNKSKEDLMEIFQADEIEE